MKTPLPLLVVINVYLINAQTVDYNTKNGFVAQCYDVVSYFSHTSTKGINQYVKTYDGARYKFLSQNNLDLFQSNPKMYVPQYGGYFTYAFAIKPKKIGINPETYDIRDIKLYLFYNSWGTNTLKSWKKESPNDSKFNADQNCKRLNKN